MHSITRYEYHHHTIEAIETPEGPVLTEEQIGIALGYSSPAVSVANLVARNAAELDGLATFIDLVKVEGGRDVKRQVRVWGEEGVLAITLLARTNNAMQFRKWARQVLYAARRGAAPVSEVDRLAAMLRTDVLPALTGRIATIGAAVEEQALRLATVEERQRLTDPREIETRMFELHKLKRDLVAATKGTPVPVTHPAFWRALKEHCQISSFQHRAALDVPLMDRAIAFARNWCFERGVQPPTLFDAAAKAV